MWDTWKSDCMKALEWLTIFPRKDCDCVVIMGTTQGIFQQTGSHILDMHPIHHTKPVWKNFKDRLGDTRDTLIGIIHEQADFHAAITSTGLNITTWIPPPARTTKATQREFSGLHSAFSVDGGEGSEGAWQTTCIHSCSRQTQLGWNLPSTTINFRSKTRLQMPTFMKVGLSDTLQPFRTTKKWAIGSTQQHTHTNKQAFQRLAKIHMNGHATKKDFWSMIWEVLLHCTHIIIRAAWLIKIKPITIGYNLIK